MSICPSEDVLGVKYNFAKYIVETIHVQLVNFSTLKCVRYQAYLMHLFLHQNHQQFQDLYSHDSSSLQGSDSTSLWRSLIVKNSRKDRMFFLVNKVMARDYFFLFESMPPRISSELKENLHLVTETRVHEWFLFKYYIVLRIYGFEDDLYFLPTFPTSRVYALEYIRKIFLSYLEQFGKIHKPLIFKMYSKIGPFTVKHQSTKDIVEKLLKEYNF